MKLIEAIQQWEKEKHFWPDGFNFKTKSKFIGIKCDEIKLTQALLDSDDWGFVFQPMDKETQEAIVGLVNSMNGLDE